MQQGGCRQWTGGITVPSHSSATSKGSPLKNPLAEWQGLPSTYSHLAQHYPSGQHCYNEPQWLCFPRTGAPASLDFWGRAPSPVKAGQYHVTGVLGCMAWYKKAALCLHEQGDTGSSKDWLHYIQLSENKMFQLQA